MQQGISGLFANFDQKNLRNSKKSCNFGRRLASQFPRKYVRVFIKMRKVLGQKGYALSRCNFLQPFVSKIPTVAKNHIEVR